MNSAHFPPRRGRSVLCETQAVQKGAQVFNSFREVEAAEDATYDGMSPADRVDLLLEIVARHRENWGESGRAV